MICPSCQRVLPDDMAFCKYCGASTTPPPEPERSCGVCGAKLEPGLKYCGRCGNPQDSQDPNVIQIRPLQFETTPPAPAPAEDPGPQQPPVRSAPKNRRKALWITLSAISVVLVIAIVAGLMTNWFGFYGPTAKIIDAAGKTLTAKNYTVTINATAGDHTADTVTMLVALDIEKRDLTIVSYTGDEITSMIYDGYQFSYLSYPDTYYATDISEGLDQFFDAIDSDGPFDLAELIREIDEDTYDQMDETLFMDKLDACLNKISRQYNSDKWLKETAGMTTKKSGSDTTYTFSPDTYELVIDTVSLTEEAFRDEDDFEEMMDSLKESKYDMEELQFDLAFTLSKGNLTEITYDSNIDDTDVSVEIKFSDIGETDIDYDLLDDIYAEATFLEP